MDPAVEAPQQPSPEPVKTRGRRSPESPAALPAAATATSAPAPELIARRAYALFQARGGDHGNDVEDWLEAERELIDLTAEARILPCEINEPPAN